MSKNGEVTASDIRPTIRTLAAEPEFVSYIQFITNLLPKSWRMLTAVGVSGNGWAAAGLKPRLSVLLDELHSQGHSLGEQPSQGTGWVLILSHYDSTQCLAKVATSREGVSYCVA